MLVHLRWFLERSIYSQRTENLLYNKLIGNYIWVCIKGHLSAVVCICSIFVKVEGDVSLDLKKGWNNSSKNCYGQLLIAVRGYVRQIKILDTKLVLMGTIMLLKWHPSSYHVDNFPIILACHMPIVWQELTSLILSNIYKGNFMLIRNYNIFVWCYSMKRVAPRSICACNIVFTWKIDEWLNKKDKTTTSADKALWEEFFDVFIKNICWPTKE